MRHVIAAALCMGFLSLMQAQTIVAPGEVSGLWTKSNSPYQITGNIQIQPGATLTIEPGVMVEFQGHFELKVMGRLLAEGSISDTIVFTVNDTIGFYNQEAATGAWYGIRIYDIGPENDSTKLAFCKLEYGKAIGPGWYHDSGGALCVINFDKVSVTNCLFINNKACGPDEESPAGGAVYFEFSDLKFSGNTLLNNNAHSGGALSFFESDPVFSDNYFAQNHSTSGGGALWGGGISNPSFYRDIFQENASDEMGGGILLQGTETAEMDQITATDNSANWAGGLGFLSCVVEIENSIISDNLAHTLGGGIAADDSKLSIGNTFFDSDSATLQGGAIHSWVSELTLNKTSFRDNRSGLGGAIHSDWCSARMDSSQFLTNAASIGGAIKLFNSHLSMDNCLMEDNVAAEDGGAMDYAVDTLVFDSLFVVEISQSRFGNNQAGRAAGGFSIQQTHTRHPMLNLHIDHCEISENTAHHVGGFRILRCLQDLVFSNSIIRGNRAAAWSGGGNITSESQGHVFNCLFVDNHSDTLNNGATSGGLGISAQSKIDVIHSTFAGNTAGRGGGLQLYRGGEAIVTNSIFWDNEPEQVALSSVDDSFPCQLILNSNDIQHGPDSIKITDLISSFLFGVGNLDTLPLFADPDLGDYHLLDASPLLGAGIDSLEIEGDWYYIPENDLDGNPRPAPAGSPPDIGAYENNLDSPVGIEPDLTGIDGGFYVRIYPNPFKGSTRLELYSPEWSLTKIEIFNLLGELVHEGNSTEIAEGIQIITWRPPPGDNHIFLYRISMQTESGQVFVRTGKMMRIR